MAFEYTDFSAIDPARDIEIFPPRIEATLQPGELEFQFSIRHHNDATGIATSGSMTMLDGEITCWIYRISDPYDLDAMDSIRRYIAPDLDLCQFVHYISDGLTATTASGIGIFETTVIRVVVEASSLRNRGFNLSKEYQIESGHVVLAERLIQPATTI